MFHFPASPPKTNNPSSIFTWMSIRAEMALSLVIILGIHRLFTGMTTLGTAILLIGSVASMAILFGLSRGIRQLLTSFPRYIPYLFGLYLFFVEGFWHLTQILRDFSIYRLVLVFFFLLVGSSIASTGYSAIQQAHRMREGH